MAERTTRSKSALMNKSVAQGVKSSEKQEQQVQGVQQKQSFKKKMPIVKLIMKDDSEAVKPSASMLVP